MAFDNKGNLYTGSFGDGRFWVLTPQKEGKYSQPELLSEVVTCCDGICYDSSRNRILLTASEQNAIFAWEIDRKEMNLIWANGDTDGATGLLDQPCELLMLDDDQVLIVNIDAPSPFMVNQKTDAIHTLSVINLKQRSRN